MHLKQLMLILAKLIELQS